MSDFPKIKLGIVDGEELPEIAGLVMALTYPTIVFHVDGKEVLRFARFVPMDQFRMDVKKLYELVTG